MPSGRANGLRATLISTAMVLCLGWVGTGAASANGPVGANPTANFPIGQLPLACQFAPTSAACIKAGVYWLDQARATLHQPPYKLPASFTSLTTDKQAFILTNLDRIQYGLAPITGLTRELDGFALTGVRDDADPVSTDIHFQYDTANWAGDYTNLPIAYEAWMYDDGPGSTNLDCTPTNTSGCWGHRHDVLWDFTASTAAAMGAATGVDTSGVRGYAMLLGKGDSSYAPVYYYTWSQAVAAGAGTHSYAVSPPPRLEVLLKTHGQALKIYISAPAHARVTCQLSVRSNQQWRADGKSFACHGPLITYPKVPAGRYRVQVRGLGLTVTKFATVH